ncbi:MAG: acetylornithine deacetylase [Acetobacteraceae bacterium]|jgi:acetylornithine deacetylase
MNRLQTAPSLSSTEMLARLVAFDTTSRNSNLDLIGFVRTWLDAHGVPYRLSLDPTGQKANLHATIGPVQAGGLAFSGHLDTVSTDGQTWTGDPYTLRKQNGRLIGRGACDMKGFVAAALAAVPDIKARKPSRPVHLLLTYDEEVGYHGARRLIEDLAESRLHPAACVVGEASGMLPILAQKGRLIARVGVRGHAAHSSEAHRGVNAVHAAAEAMAFLAAASRRHAHSGPTEAGFDPPYTTLQISNLTCDGLPNTLPDRAGFDVEWRNIPADDPVQALARFQAHAATAIEPQMRALRADTGFEYEVLLDLAALSMSPEHELARAACAITGASGGGKVSYCSEGSLFQPAGVACMVCGPGHVSQVHQPDEWIAESQLAACDDFLRRLVDRMAV